MDDAANQDAEAVAVLAPSSQTQSYLRRVRMACERWARRQGYIDPFDSGASPEGPLEESLGSWDEPE